MLLRSAGLFFVFKILISKAISQSLPACDSEIFCQGPLLDAAQRAYIYNDSKSFVDMKLNQNPDVVLGAFNTLYNSSNGTISDDAMTNFVAQYFSPPGSEFQDWIPEDWITEPAFTSRIFDSSLRQWASDLNNLWKVLGRKIIDDVVVNNTLYSLIPVSNPVIVPGGRFREFYYWDTYWVAKGLILSEMTSTLKGMLENFLSMVKKYGFVPNGGRIYYERRSQPPFLTLMVKDYFNATGDTAFLSAALPTLEKEYRFWMTERNVTVESHQLNRYASHVNQPRPESYREDKTAIKDLTPEEGMKLMTHVTSAAESGWDFSTRWTGTSYASESGVISQLCTRDIIPVDLNSILALSEKTLAEFHRILGNESMASTYDDRYRARVEAIEAILWNETDGIYYDYVLSAGAHNRNYYASNLNPLWTKCYPSGTDVTSREARIYHYLQTTGVLNYPGGIPTSKRQSGEQWDFPNAWPPLVHMIIEGMRTSAVESMREEAFKQAQKWIWGNYKAYLKTNSMFEKYDVTVADGVPGSGGEYDVQKGFGWSNGVVMSFLNEYGDKLTANETATATLTSEATLTVTTPNMETTSEARSLTNPSRIFTLIAVSILVIIVFVM